ncbi:MAG: MFS transporter [bacterium]
MKRETEKKPQTIPIRYAVYALAVLFLCNLFNYIDRNSINPMAETIIAEFHLNDTQWGLITSAFMYVYCILAFPMAWLSDRGSRTRIISLGVLIWSISTVFTGFARNFTSLFLARALVGSGEGMYSPSSSALACDYFPAKRRNTVIAILMSTLIIGPAAGLIMGGKVMEIIGWRKVFFIVGPPGLLLALLAYLLREPVKGAQEGYLSLDEAMHINSKVSERPIRTELFELFKMFIAVVILPLYALKFVSRFFRPYSVIINFIRSTRLSRFIDTPTLLFLMFTGCCVTFSLGGLIIWIFPYVERKWGVTSGDAVMSAGLPVIGACVVGIIVSGVGADFLNRFTRRGPVYLMVAGILIGSPFLLFFLMADNYGLAIMFLTVGSFFMSWYNGLSNAMQMNLVEPHFRAMISAIFIFLIHFYGDAPVGPIVGRFSDLYDLHTAMLILPIVGIVGAFIAVGAIFTVEKDLDTVQKRLKEAAVR